MSKNIIRQLALLKKDSGQRLSGAVSTKSYEHLVRTTSIQNGSWITKPRGETSSLLHNTHYREKTLTFDEANINYMTLFNRQLMGGESYPVLTTALGLAGIPGALFSVASTAIDLHRRSTNVLARLGDELWYTEEIGKTLEDNTFSPDRFIPIFVSAFHLVDPFRHKGSARSEKGWLIHEKRKEIILDSD